MSARRIKEVLTYMQHNPSPGMSLLVFEALREVETIEKACRTLEAESIGDGVYAVRDRAASDTSFTGNTWEHPRVVAYGEAVQVITNIAKESK